MFATEGNQSAQESSGSTQIIAFTETFSWTSMLSREASKGRREKTEWLRTRAVLCHRSSGGGICRWPGYAAVSWRCGVHFYARWLWLPCIRCVARDGAWSTPKNYHLFHHAIGIHGCDPFRQHSGQQRRVPGATIVVDGPQDEYAAADLQLGKRVLVGKYAHFFVFFWQQTDLEGHVTPQISMLANLATVVLLQYVPLCCWTQRRVFW